MKISRVTAAYFSPTGGTKAYAEGSPPRSPRRMRT